MPYVPPHLRNGGGGGGSSTEGSAPPGGPPSRNGSGFGNSFGGGGSFRDSGPSRGNSGYGRRDDYYSGGRGGGMERAGSLASAAGGSLSRNGSTVQLNEAEGGGARLPRVGSSATMKVDPVFEPWAPTERVLGLSEEQIAEIRGRLNVTVEVREGQPPAPSPIESFRDMNLHENIMADIKHHKYETPTPIQCQGIPIGLSGLDILGCAETGSGKTASFSIPMVQHCLNQPPLRPGDGPLGLVLAPTRELAQQIEREISAFSRSSRNVRTCIVVGGMQMHEQRQELRSGVEIVVATPGRFIDHLQHGNTNLNRVCFMVLDEADRMLDMGFEPQIKEVMSRLPPAHQTLLFSATMPKEIESLANGYLKNPVTIKVGAVSTPTANVAQSLEYSAPEGKLELLTALLAEEAHQASAGGPEMCLTVVFVERKNRCDEVAEALREEGIPAVALHGGLGQNERDAALRDFSNRLVKVLVATDVASRGLDIKGIGHVVNMDLPKSFEDYVHRIGRTGRAGTKGRATSFWSDRDSFLVSQIKTALAELEKGGAFAFASGKSARQEERQLAAAFKASMKMSAESDVGAAAVKVDEKYSFMAKAPSMGAAMGAADAAWDD